MPNDTGTPVLAETPVAESWIAYLTPFAQALSISIEDATAKLAPVVGEPSEEAIALLKDPSMSPDTELKAALNGTPSAVANRAISLLREVAVTHAPMAFATGADILPPAPTDENWLSALRAGGTLKVDEATVVSAVKAALAYRVGFFDIPDLLVRRMEEFADANADPVSPEYFRLRKQITQRAYGDIFAAIPGLDGTFVTDKRRAELFRRVDATFWPSLVSFHGALRGWMDAWQQGANNPGAMMNAIMMIAGGGGAAAMPPGMMAPPDTGTLRDQADAFNDDVNKVFAGTIAPVASALAFDAKNIKETLENPGLPAMVGAANREQMLRQLGVEVSATYPRMETNLTRYVLSVMSVKDLSAGNDELQFFSSLFMLGTNIPWDQLGAKRPTRRGE